MDKANASEPENESLEDLLNDFVAKSGEWLTDKELAVIQKFKAEIARLNADCEKGRLCGRSGDLLDRYSGDNNIEKAK